MEVCSGKAYVRKNCVRKKGIKDKKPVTLVLLAIQGDLPGLKDESMNVLNVVGVDGTLIMTPTATDTSGKFERWLAEDILREM